MPVAVSIPASTLEKFSTFGDLLRYLRRAAGLTQFELSVQVGYSHAQISRLEQNLRLPDIPTIEARFVPALSLESEPKVVARLLELAANVRREDAPGLGLCPYKGLSYFDEADADLFVGREALTAKLIKRVLSLVSGADRTRFLAIVGASGSGKSSLVRAGLVPALRWNKKSSDWQIHILAPTAHPLESLAASLTSDSNSVIATSTLMDDLSRDPRSLQIFIKRRGGTGHREIVGYEWKRNSIGGEIPPSAVQNLPGAVMADITNDGTPDAYWDNNLTLRRMDDNDRVDRGRYQRSWNWSGMIYWAVREGQGQIGWPGQ